MDQSSDHMDLYVGGDDRRGATWWERLTKDSARMRELVGKLNQACFPIDASKTCPEVDTALEEVYYSLDPPHARGTHISESSFSTARAHTISAINDLGRQNHSGAVEQKDDMGAFSMSHFLGEDYPGPAPFNTEALPPRANDSTGDGGYVASSHGSSGGLRGGTSLPLRKRPRTGGRSHPRDSRPHPHPHSGNPATHTLNDSQKSSPGGSSGDSPGASGTVLSDGCLSTDRSTTSSLSPAIRNHSHRRTYPHPRSVLNRDQGQPPVPRAYLFEVPFPRVPDARTDVTRPGGQHKCDECGLTFPYPSKLKDHKHIHRPDKPLPCHHPDCPKAFKRARELQAHKKTHERRAAGNARPQIRPTTKPPVGPTAQSPVPPPPAQCPPGPLCPDECPPKSEVPYSDRTPPASPEDERTLSRSPSPASSHTGRCVATSEPPIVDEQGRKVLDLTEP
ncbi:unnamed protein product, partial [Tuber aestivum]